MNKSKPLSVEDGTEELPPLSNKATQRFIYGNADLAFAERTAQLKQCIAEKQPAVPVEERTQDNAQNLRYATQIAEYLHKNCYPEVTQWKPISGDLFGVLMQIDNMCTGVQRNPIPEERTAEMDQLMGRLRAKINDFLQRGGSLESRIYLRNAFQDEASAENILKLLDHIEGKGK